MNIEKWICINSKAMQMFGVSLAVSPIAAEFSRIFGREVAKAEGIMQEVRIPLDPGIYTVEAVGSDAGRKSAKVQIR